MKNLFKTIIAFLVVLGSAQAQETKTEIEKKTIKYGEVSMEIVVDSLDEIDSVFQLKDLTELIETTEANENMSFKITCNGDTNSSGKKNHISYEIFGNSDEPENFVVGVEKILKSAKNYYLKKQ